MCHLSKLRRRSGQLGNKPVRPEQACRRGGSVRNGMQTTVHELDGGKGEKFIAFRFLLGERGGSFGLFCSRVFQRKTKRAGMFAVKGHLCSFCKGAVRGVVSQHFSPGDNLQGIVGTEGDMNQPESNEKAMEKTNQRADIRGAT